MLDCRSAAPVILKCFELYALTLVPCNYLVWACSDRLLVEVVTALNKLSRKDRITMVAEVRKKTGLRAVCCDLDRIVVNNLNRTGGDC